ncbi:hypothetical protein EIP91_006645 [Steccherinum ochraceum]|uniref:DBF4-type domain-containing protein n=1 Tax=Steccherinum ochraceum TaxID=92696 RepID=A0A4R0RDQ2_9APHY|nr:hypothetical protein EIP91_006645 [Steccherinum ochraceum]
MTTLLRSPLTVRSPSLHLTPAYSPAVHKTSSIKRAHSPEPREDVYSHPSKRAKPATAAAAASTSKEEPSRKSKSESRLAKEAEFRDKYTRAFPKWKFYFDIDDVNAAKRDDLKSRILEMGATVEIFFSQNVTHLITDEPEQSYSNKENTSRSRSQQLQSPIKLKGREAAPESGAHLVKKALDLDLKIWSPSKLDSILIRCLSPDERTVGPSTSNTHAAHAPGAAGERSLSRLLESERLHGTTERDPTQRRHDYLYFSKNSYFVLVEDLKQELATIAALEYPIKKDREGKEKGSWPVLHCHPQAKGPFLAFDEKKEEERRRQKIEHAEKERERRKAKDRDEQRRKQAQRHAMQQGDLRRSVSMNNLHRRATFPFQEPPERAELVDLDADADEDEESANASGLRESGQYVAASGNSVGITSTVGTTSTAGGRLRMLQLPARISRQLGQEVVTSRRISAVPNFKNDKENAMGPPPVPDKISKPLRKSKSTNTLKLPKRDEGTKPGYCESCRQKFEDFKTHVTGRRHRKFAMDDSNFLALDYVLDRVKRRTVEEVQAERRSWQSGWEEEAEEADYDEDADVKVEPQEDSIADDFQWDDWVAADDTEDVKAEVKDEDFFS